jgi:hypothetical protein
MKSITLLSLLAAGLALAGTPSDKTVGNLPIVPDWKDHTSSPVADLIYFEDPIVRTEIRPVFMYHQSASDFFSGPGDTYIYGLRAGYAITERFGAFIYKGGYMDVRPGVGPAVEGIANVGLGAKYMLIDDAASQFVFTLGGGYELPIGDKALGWDNGDGELSLFFAAEKGWGDFHLIASGGVRLPIDGDANSTILRYGLQADYFANRYFIPFVQGVAYRVIDPGKALPLTTEGVDAQNFGAAFSDGSTQGILGVGFRSRITDTINVGFAYQKTVSDDKGIFDDRITVDVQFKF